MEIHAYIVKGNITELADMLIHAANAKTPLIEVRLYPLKKDNEDASCKTCDA